ncbi:heavy metal-binding domain-containing protein [Chitinophaga oryziterrae]|uniref:heavy metal-binding domain-containing protein n=1 Tax=Chitinophaga oryziterrae TaxID=1031224 RepID=UPI003B837606
MIDHVVQNERLLYTCPIHPEVVMDRPGICPECGMQLVPKEPEIRIAGESMTILKRQK